MHSSEAPVHGLEAHKCMAWRRLGSTWRRMCAAFSRSLDCPLLLAGLRARDPTVIQPTNTPMHGPSDLPCNQARREPARRCCFKRWRGACARGGMCGCAGTAAAAAAAAAAAVVAVAVLFLLVAAAPFVTWLPCGAARSMSFLPSQTSHMPVTLHSVAADSQVTQLPLPPARRSAAA